jgi:hypothetical protein
MAEQPVSIFPKMRAFATDRFSQTASNVSVCNFVEVVLFWNELMVNNSLA